MSYSKKYLKELQKLHSKKTFGLSSNIPKIVSQLIEDKDIKSFLDFGAGKGNTSATVSQKYPHIELHSFDPVTFPNPLPESVELVYSSDVLEHIEPERLEETIQDLSNRATRYQYHLIACHPAKKTLSDGRNAHLIIEQPDWWKQKIENVQGWKIIHEDVIDKTTQPKKGPLLHVVKYIVIMEKQ